MLSASRTARFAAVGAGAALAAAASAQYSTDFEGLTIGPLTGQDDFYIPPGTTSVDFLVDEYATTLFNVPQNPGGGDKFIVGLGPGGGAFARAQRDITWGSGVWKVTYDALAGFELAPPATNNLGSFSGQPTSNYIHLFSWVDLTAATHWRAFYLGYNAAGVIDPQPGRSPGPEWTDLELHKWYRFETTLDLDANKITEVAITDLATGVRTVSGFTDLYLAGGSAGGQMTGFRFFGGGGGPGNFTAWDNLVIEELPTCYADCDESGSLDFFDFLCFQNRFLAGDPWADCDNSGSLDFFDFLCFQNAFLAGCP